MIHTATTLLALSLGFASGALLMTLPRRPLTVKRGVGVIREMPRKPLSN